MSLESALDKPPVMLGGDSNQSGEEDKERSSSSHGINSTLLYPMNQSTFTALDGVSSHKAGQRPPSDGDPMSDAPPPVVEQQDEEQQQQQEPPDLEDGELEDGELDDEDDATTMVPPAAEEAAEPEADADAQAKQPPGELETEECSSQKEKPPKEDPASATKSDSDDTGDDEREKRRRKKKKKRKREEREREKKKKKKNPKYIDHDQVADDYPDYPAKNWGGRYSRSPPGPYDSPYDSPPSLEQTPPHGYQDLDASRGFERSPPGPYDSPYDSPPGPYDSPDDEYGPPPKLQRMENRDKSQKRMRDLLSGKSEKQSLMDLYGGEYMDSNVAASEREELFDRRRKASEGSRQRKLEKAQRYKELMRKREQEAAERRSASKQQQCKFFMDGKCQRGRDCPFSHDFQPPRKLEVCKFYMINACAKGEKCLYMHDDYPCRAFLLDGRCPEKDDCLFSHREQEEYEEELQPLIQKFLRGEDYESTQQRKREGGGRDREREHESPRKRPSLLGSPPRNLENKSIPSIFDIKVYPPGQGPPASQTATSPAGMGTSGSTAGPRGPSGPMGGPIPPPGAGAPGSRPMRPFRDPRMPMGMPGPGMMGMPGPRGMMMPPMGMDGGPFRPPGPGSFYGSGFYQPQPGDQPPDIESPEVKDGQDGSLQDSKADKSSDMEKTSGSLTGDIQAMPGVDKSDLEDIAAHLPPVQRELFLRIQRQQQQKIPEAQASKKDEEDNWYSSDEESPSKQQESKPQQQQQKQQQPPVMNNPMPMGNQVNPMARMNMNMMPQGPPGFDISQMLSAIRQSMGPMPGTSWPGMNTPQQSMTDPRAKSSDPRTSKSRSADPRRGSAPVAGIKLAVPEIDATISTTGGVKYYLYTVAIPLEQGLPSHVDATDPRYKNDPRVHKPEKRKLRRQSTEKYKDPRMSRPDPHPKPDLDMGSRAISAPANSSPPSDMYTPSKTYSMPEALTQMPKLLDPRLAKQFSGNATATLDLDTESTKSESRIPFSHRNDPRFKFKKKSKDATGEETGAGLSSPSGDVTPDSKETAAKDPRKRGLEHASPLELDSVVDKSGGYNTYNKILNPSFKVKKDYTNSSNGSPSSRNTETPPVVESLSTLPTMNEDVESLPDLPVKDIFKTIDPTASPFC